VCHGSHTMVCAEVLKVKFSCPFDFKNFPFDSNQCCLTYGDFIFGTNVTLGSPNIIYDNMITEDGPIILNSLPFPFMVKITEKPSFVNIDRFDKKEYSRAGMCIALTRTNRGNLDSGYYYPSTAFALLSMISYLINPDIVSLLKVPIKFHKGNIYWSQKVPGRMGMIVTLYLISANVYNSVEGPKSKGFSYIEIWMIGTQIPILLALVEYGLIFYLKKTSKEFEDKNVRLELGKPKKSFDDKIKTLDFATRIISCVYFIAFAAIYWIVASLAIN
jgi:hypothetical protein